MGGVLVHGALEFAGAYTWLWIVDFPLALTVAFLARKWGLGRSGGVRLLAVLHISLAVLAAAFLLYGLQSAVLAAGYALNVLLADHLFPQRADGGDPRTCPACENGKLSLKLGRYGAFVGCSNYPECRFTRQLGASVVQARTARIKLATLAPKGTSFHLILQEMGQEWRKGPDDGAALTIFTDGLRVTVQNT